MPENPVITGAFSDIILQGRERESLLTVANDLLDVLANSANEAPLGALTLENIFNPRQLPGNIIGGVTGFCQGGFIGAMLLLLITVLAPGGAAIDRFIGNMLTRAK